MQMLEVIGHGAVCDCVWLAEYGSGVADVPRQKVESRCFGQSEYLSLTLKLCLGSVVIAILNSIEVRACIIFDIKLMFMQRSRSNGSEQY